jgi:hypothetical protein
MTIDGTCSTCVTDKCIENVVGKPERKNCLRDLGINEWIILKWILKMEVMTLWTGFNKQTQGRECAGFPRVR